MRVLIWIKMRIATWRQPPVERRTRRMDIEANAEPRRGLSPRMPAGRAWLWLAAGWRDLMAAPMPGVVIGGGVTLAGWALVVLMIQAGMGWAILPATAGFFLVAPVLAAGIYEASRLREVGEAVTLRDALRGGYLRNAPQLGLLGVALLLLHLFWIRVAGLLFALFFSGGFTPPLADLPMALLTSERLLPFLVAGSAIGAGFAALAFAISAVSIPMLVDRPEMSAGDAMVRSLRAVLAQPRAMAFWAALIVVLLGLALMPFFLGLALVLPLVGHATWHAYRDLRP